LSFSFSLVSTANHLQNSSAKPAANGYEIAAKAKRCQFKQKGRSMNSTGSGKSSTTVSSVSELLDLYEEDPEEILYNLGFGREEPDIASKIPSRFFNSSSSAKGIDIKVYLGAQIQRMELENPNYALTSRFRQTEVLATVANVFSEIYSQVSGRPMERIGSGDTETKTPSPLKRNNSALNAAKILKRNITKQNLLASAMEGAAKQLSASDADNTEGANSDVRAGLMDTEHKLQQKGFRKKDSSLATVTEEAQQSISEASVNGDVPEPLPKDSLMNGDHSTETPALDKDVPLSPVQVSISRVSDESDFKILERQDTITSTLDKEPSNLLPNPHIAHLLSQPRDSFEMEEVRQSHSVLVLTLCLPIERLLRTASQQSDSSGFAEDPITDGLVNHLKVQESSDSCDSETTVTSHAGEVRTPTALEYPNFERLQGEEAHPQSNKGTFSQSGANREVPEISSLQIPNSDSDNISTNEPLLSPDSDRTSIVESNFTTSSDLPESSDLKQCNPTTQRRQMALQTAHQRSSSMDEERPGRVWVRDRNLLRESLERNPLRRSSSLPTSQLSPARVVTSMRIQLGKGSVKHCTPPSYSYRYDEENRSDREEVDSIMEEDEVDHAGGQSTLLNSAPAGGLKTGRGTPPHLLNVPQHLTRSSSSLYSVPADWLQRPLGEGPNWSTCSVPNLSQFTGPGHPPPHGSFYSPHQGVAYNSSTEMQLRRVLHDIRGTMQNLGQSSSVHGGDTPIDRISTPRSVQPLYEELQMRRRSLNVFRTQMMDLELALMRQQSMELIGPQITSHKEQKLFGLEGLESQKPVLFVACIRGLRTTKKLRKNIIQNLFCTINDVT
uniref:Sperm-specific antigen 2-like n=1 Tax=Sinocyclocheilus anshuiensis TaxID=1608454 RepID=A0A671S627_9TELE